MNTEASKQWWDRVKENPELLNEWLIKQYRGELNAFHMLSNVVDKYTLSQMEEKILYKIMSQESAHSFWIFDLAVSRGISRSELLGSVGLAVDRYWKDIIPNIRTIADVYQAGALAEDMRLARISVIAQETDPGLQDIVSVFKRILKQERFHAKAFKALLAYTEDEADIKLISLHEDGLQKLGLL